MDSISIDLESRSMGRGEGAKVELGAGEGALVSGGGSMELEMDGLENMADSGSGVISSSLPVSMVNSFVEAVVVRIV